MTERGRRPAGDRPPLDAKAARRVAIDLLARKAWSRRDLTRRLERRGAPADVAADVVNDLAARGYLDDAEFARWWAEARAQRRRVGSVRLRQELALKGIARDTASDAVRAAFEDASELDRALDAGRRRLASLARADPARRATRLGDYLLRRGYPASIVSRVVRTLMSSDPAVADSPEDGGV